MKWKLRSPKVFPASFSESVQISIFEGREVILFTSPSLHACKRKMEQFRYYRWCLRNSGYSDAMAEVEKSKKIRSRVAKFDIGTGRYAVLVRVVPSDEQSLIASTPALSDLTY